MSTVYAALQTSSIGTDRLVAVKVVARPLMDDAPFRALFAREASIATRLEHGNVVRTYEVGEADGELFLAMEYLHGPRLSQLLAAPMPLGIVLRIICDLASALHAAHELRGPDGEVLDLVHLDVSPQNVIVRYDGTTKLLDFGVARLVALDGSRTQTVRGKPAYLAPEQIQGGRIDRRTDVFALGAIFYELLTGKRLFRRQTPDASYAAILVGAIPDALEARPDLPPPLAAIVARALRREISERFTTADELCTCIREIAAGLDLTIATPAAVGAWVTETLPPRFEPVDLEREIARGISASEVAGDIFDMPTVDPGPSSAPPMVTAPDVAATSHRRARAWVAVGVSASAIVIALVAALGKRSTVARPLSSVASSSALLAAPSAAPLNTLTAASTAAASALASTGPSAGAAEPALASGRPDAVPASIEATAVPQASSAGPRPGPSRGAAHRPHLRRAHAAPSLAHLSVWSSVWGTVSVDGATIGESPIMDLPLTKGRHLVMVSTSQGTKQQSVVLSAGDSSKVRFVF